MTHECDLLGVTLVTTSLFVKEVASADESPRLPKVGIHAIDCSRMLLTIDSDSLVKTLLRGSEPAESPAEVLITALDNLNCVGIDLTHGTHSSVSISEFVLEGPASTCRPVDLAAQVVLSDHVLVRLKPKRIHFL